MHSVASSKIIGQNCWAVCTKPWRCIQVQLCEVRSALCSRAGHRAHKALNCSVIPISIVSSVHSNAAIARNSASSSIQLLLACC